MLTENSTMASQSTLQTEVQDEKEMEGLELEADKDILSRLKELFGFDEWTKAVASNREKETHAKEAKGEPLGKEEARNFRAAAALLNYYAQDSPDALFAAKEASKDMANPREGSWIKIKRLVRFF